MLEYQGEVDWDETGGVRKEVGAAESILSERVMMVWMRWSATVRDVRAIVRAGVRGVRVAWAGVKARSSEPAIHRKPRASQERT